MSDIARAGRSVGAGQGLLCPTFAVIRRVSRHGRSDLLQLPWPGRRRARHRRFTRRWRYSGHRLDLSLRHASRAILLDTSGGAVMTQPFVAQLRARTSTIRLVPHGASGITLRVEMPEVWDTVRFVVAPREPLLTLKVRALEALFPEAELHSDFVLKFRGW